MAQARFALDHMIAICLCLGWGVALAGAIASSVRLLRTQERLARTITWLLRLALLLLGVGVLLAGVVGPTLWIRAPASSMLAIAGASLLLLCALVLHPSGAQRRHRIFDLVLAWATAAAGVWGCALGIAVITSVATL